jgi:quercetin 2,3-dioxygenase
LILRSGVSVRRGADRHQTRIGWRHGRRSFDTGIDPLGADTHHGVLVVNNHDTIAPRSGFETHPHRNMEIVTWVLNGSLVHHQMHLEAEGLLDAGDAARLTAAGERRLAAAQPSEVLIWEMHASLSPAASI